VEAGLAQNPSPPALEPYRGLTPTRVAPLENSEFTVLRSLRDLARRRAPHTTAKLT
jgi:hypothetical protein